MPYVRCWIVNILITFKVIIVERKQKKKINKITNIFLLFKFLSFKGTTLTRYLYDFLLCYCTSVASHQDNTFAFYYYYSLMLLVAVVVVVMVMVMLVLAFIILMSSSVKSIKQKIKKH